MMDGYSFMGMHLFWWVSIVLVALLIIVVTRRNKKKKIIKTKTKRMKKVILISVYLQSLLISAQEKVQIKLTEPSPSASLNRKLEYNN
jgi:glucan phosphoethanolaminetransferase (alkaline phosphatase superfamily)